MKREEAAVLETVGTECAPWMEEEVLFTLVLLVLLPAVSRLVKHSCAVRLVSGGRSVLPRRALKTEGQDTTNYTD
jgi:hypothetical protein